MLHVSCYKLKILEPLNLLKHMMYGTDYTLICSNIYIIYRCVRTQAPRGEEGTHLGVRSGGVGLCCVCTQNICQ